MSVVEDPGMDDPLSAMADTAASTSPVIRVFGGVDVEVSGRVIGVGGPRQRRLLALLAIRSGEVVSIDWLAEYLWNDADRPDATASALRTYVSRLRQSFPEEARDWLVTEQSGYRLLAPPDALEHQRFIGLRVSARRARESGDPAAAQRMLDSALEMWRGEPFRELEDLDWAQAEVERLRLDRLEMLEERWETALALGRHTQITGELAAFVGEQPLRERAARQYALALYRSGRITEALRVIEDHRRLLADGSGLDPSAGIVELEQAILSGDPALDLVDATPLRGYRLLEQVGAGAFSVVWRGIQPSVDRPVAIKQIRSELASQPEFIRRFEAEAHLVARIEHPHIVPLIDYWRDPDAAYLVMRWLPGGTLERLLDDGPLTVERTLEVAEQIGAALSAAHAHDIIHRDVKSANVMFDDGGNAFLTDFGIALEAAESSGPAAALSTGSPAYASPEQLRREPLGPASDIFSLAVVVYECLAGRTPFADSASAELLLHRQLHEVPASVTEVRSDLPPHVADAVARALAKDPADRFDSVGAFIDALRSPVASSAQVTAPAVVGENPYLGLRAFDEADAGRFFGRSRLVTELVQRMSSDDVLVSRSLIVVGPSGSGKSSVVRAGLLPALRDGAVPGSGSWFTTTMVPGVDPFESLEAALLRIAVNPPVSLLDQLRDGPRGILRAARRCLPDEGDTLVLVVDQFEEIFLGRSAGAGRFLEALAVAADDPSGPMRLIATLRADYYHRPLEHATFAPILKRSAVDVTPLAPDEMEEAIVGPARLAGLEFETGLVARIAAETIGQPSPLPLLQHVLAQLYERRTGSVLTIAAYEDLGGVSGALAAHAESIYETAGEAERAAMRRMFGALTDPGEDRPDLRRRVPVEDLGDTQAMQWTLDRFGAARLVTFDRDVATRAPTVEVAHEALLREWPRLVGWLQEDRDMLRSVARLDAAATLWDESGRQPSDLLRGGRLTQALDLALTAHDRLRPLDRTYLDASRSHAEAEHHKERRRVRRLRQLNIGVTIALVAALVAGGIALAQRNQADRATADAERATASALTAEAEAQQARDAAELAALIGQSDALVDDNPDLAILLALEANRRSPGPSTEQAVLHALTSAPGKVTTVDLPPPDPTPCPAFDTRLTLSADGTTGFTTSDNRLMTIDLTTGTVTDHGPAPAPCVQWTGDENADIRWVYGGTPAGVTYWSGTWDGDLREAQIENGRGVAPGIGPGIVAGSVVGDRMLVFGAEEKVRGGSDLDWTEVLVVDSTSARAIAGVESSLGSTVLGPSWANAGDAWAISDDGRFVVVAQFETEDEGGQLVVLDGRTGDELHRIHVDQPSTAIGIRGDVAFVGGLSGLVATIDLTTGEVISEILTTAGTGIFAIGARADGSAVVVSEDRVELVDPELGTVGRPLQIEVGAAAVRQDGRITVVDPDQTHVSTIEMQSTALVESSIDIQSSAAVGFGAGQAALVLPSGEIETIDLRTGHQAAFDPARAEEALGTAIAAFPTAHGLVTFEEDGVVSRWEGNELTERVQLTATNVGEVAFAPPDLAGTDISPGPAHASSGAIVVFRRNWESAVYLIAWDGDGLDTRFANSLLFIVSAIAAEDGGIHVLAEDGLLRSYDSAGHWVGETVTGLRYPVAVARDGHGLVAAGGIGGVVIVDAATGESLSVPGIGDVTALAFAGDGELLVMMERDGGVQLWDVTTRELAGEIWTGTGPVDTSQPWFDPERGTVWVATRGRLLELSLDRERWIENACAFVGHDITPEEWDRYVPGDEPLRSICPVS